MQTHGWQKIAERLGAPAQTQGGNAMAELPYRTPCCVEVLWSKSGRYSGHIGRQEMMTGCCSSAREVVDALADNIGLAVGAFRSVPCEHDAIISQAPTLFACVDLPEAKNVDRLAGWMYSVLLRALTTARS